MCHPHSADLHVIERFRRLDVGHLEIDVTIDDPKAYGKRFTYTLRHTLIPDQDLYEYFCTENEKDVQHFKMPSPDRRVRPASVAARTGSILSRAPASSSVSRYKSPSGPCLTSRIRCLSSTSRESRRMGSPLAFKTTR